MKMLTLFITGCLIASPSFADLHIQFQESAPKDRFVITNKGKCAIQSAEVKIDLTQSNGGLIFDVTASGPGVEVFQPFELVAGNQYVIGRSSVSDGSKAISLQLAGLEIEKSVVFTIDVDDTLGDREITVLGSEMKGATISAMFGNLQTTTIVGDTPSVMMKARDCLS